MHGMRQIVIFLKSGIVNFKEDGSTSTQAQTKHADAGYEALGGGGGISSYLKL